MKTNKETYPEIGKTVSMDFSIYEDKTVIGIIFQDKAIKSGCSVEEFDQVVAFLVGKPFEEQLSILEYYTRPPVPNTDNLHQRDVGYLLSFLGQETHYLDSKPIELWDTYDWSNYRSLEQKATRRLVKKYAFYDHEVEERYKYDVDSPPTTFFDSYEEAKSKLPQESLANTHIYALWIEE